MGWWRNPLEIEYHYPFPLPSHEKSFPNSTDSVFQHQFSDTNEVSYNLDEFNLYTNYSAFILWEYPTW